MNKKVSVNVSGIHSMGEEEDDDRLEVINIGTYCKRNGKHYIKYDEPDERGGILKSNLLKITDKEIEITTKGYTGTHMVFTLGHKNTTFYETPFGGLNLGIDTYDISLVESEDSISVDIKYSLEINLDCVSECAVHIGIESLNE